VIYGVDGGVVFVVVQDAGVRALQVGAPAGHPKAT
jgi:hypothetical protein